MVNYYHIFLVIAQLARLSHCTHTQGGGTDSTAAAIQRCADGEEQARERQRALGHPDHKTHRGPCRAPGVLSVWAW